MHPEGTGLAADRPLDDVGDFFSGPPTLLGRDTGLFVHGSRET